jgi:hypothetical protein
LGDSGSRYKTDYDDSRVTLSGNYTYGLHFKIAVPYMVSCKVNLYASNTSGTSILNRSWYLYRYVTSWTSVATFTMPSTGEYTWEGNLGVSNILKFAAVPTATMSTGTEWTLGLSVSEMKIRESHTTVDLGTGEYFPVFPNRSGVEQRPTRVYANISGTLTAARHVYANIGGVLTELPPVYSGAFQSTVPDTMRLYEFTPPSSGTYRFEVSRKSGDHEARLYDSSFAALNDGQYFYNGSFALTGGSLYYISLTQYIGNDSAADSVIIINKI